MKGLLCSFWIFDLAHLMIFRLPYQLNKYISSWFYTSIIHYLCSLYYDLQYLNFSIIKLLSQNQILMKWWYSFHSHKQNYDMSMWPLDGQHWICRTKIEKAHEHVIMGHIYSSNPSFATVSYLSPVCHPLDMHSTSWASRSQGGERFAVGTYPPRAGYVEDSCFLGLLFKQVLK